MISVAEMRKVEEYAQSIGISSLIMMENAGANAARIVHEMAGLSGKRVTVFCGTGNNGGDGFVFARHALIYGAKVRIVLAKNAENIRTEEAKINYGIARSLGIRIYCEKIPSIVVEKTDISCDALLGIGITGDVKEPYLGMIDVFNSMKCFKVSLDCPSGINADTGKSCGAVVLPDMTATFHDAKKGLKKSNSGQIIIANIGIQRGIDIRGNRRVKIKGV